MFLDKSQLSLKYTEEGVGEREWKRLMIETVNL